MKKHSKKIFAVLALACAPAAASSGKAESQANSAAPASSKTDEAPVKLKYVNHGARPDTGNCDGIWNALNEVLLRDLNCTMEVEYLGSGTSYQMALKYAGNEDFDFAYTAGWFGFENNASNNAYYELTMDALKQYAPYMVETLPDIAWKQASVGGKIYMLPTPNIGYEYHAVLHRGDLLKKYGMSELKTLDDLEKYVEAVAKNETGIEAIAGSYQDWYEHPNHVERNGWVYDYTDPDKQECIYDVMTDEYLAYAKKMRSFYERGILPPDLINDSAKLADKFKNGIIAVDLHNVSTLSNDAKEASKAHPEWEVKLYNPFQGEPVIQNSFANNGFAITRTSKHPTKVMEVVNHILESEELQKLLIYGVEGVDYEMKDGKLYQIADVAADKKMNIGTNWNMYNGLIIDEFTVKSVYDGCQEIEDDYKKNTVSHPLQAFTFNKAEVETEVANMSAVQEEYKTLRYGMVADVEAAVAEYRQKLKDAGYDKVKAEYDRQVKEFMATYN